LRTNEHNEAIWKDDSHSGNKMTFEQLRGQMNYLSSRISIVKTRKFFFIWNSKVAREICLMVLWL